MAVHSAPAGSLGHLGCPDDLVMGCAPSRAKNSQLFNNYTSAAGQKRHSTDGAGSSMSGRINNGLRDEGVDVQSSDVPTSPWLSKPTSYTAQAGRHPKPFNMASNDGSASPQSSSTDFLFDTRGISPARPRTLLNPFLDTRPSPHAEQPDETQSIASSLASVSEEDLACGAGNECSGRKTPNSSPSTIRQRQRSSDSDSPTRIPAPNWPNLFRSLSQHKLANTRSDDPVTRSLPRLQSSTQRRGSGHSRLRSPTPLRSSWHAPEPLTSIPSTPGSGSTTPRGGDRATPIAQDMASPAPSLATLERGGYRRRSRSAESSLASSSVDDVPRFRRFESRPRFVHQSSSLAELRATPPPEAQAEVEQEDERRVLRGPVPESVQPATLERPPPGATSQDERNAGSIADQDMVIVVCDEDGRLCVVRADNQLFEPGHYQIDLDLNQRPTPPNSQLLQTIQLPSLEPTLLRGHVFHDGKMLLQIVGPWVANIMSLFSPDLVQQDTDDKTQLAGTFKLGKIPRILVRKKRELDRLRLQETQIQTAAKLSMADHDEVRVDYEVQIRAKSLAVEDALAKDIVLEFGICGVPMKSTVYFLEEGNRKVHLDLLDQHHNNQSETVITICRSPRDLGTTFRLRFSMKYTLSPDNHHVQLPSIRPMRGRLTFEAMIIRRPSPPLRAAPYAEHGAFRTWITSEEADGATTRLRRRHLPDIEPAVDRERVYVRLVQTDPVADQLPEGFRTSGKPVIMNVRYNVLTANDRFTCDVEFQVARRNWREIVELEMRDWNLLCTMINGVVHFLEPQDQLKKDGVNWYTIRKPELRAWIAVHVHMKFDLSLQTARLRYRKRRSEGCLFLPNFLDSIVMSGSVQTEIGSARLDITTWPNGQALAQETMLTPYYPASFSSIEMAHELMIIYNAPLPVGAPLNIATLKAYLAMQPVALTTVAPPDEPQAGTHDGAVLQGRQVPPVNVPPPPVEVPLTTRDANPGPPANHRPGSMDFVAYRTSTNYMRYRYRNRNSRSATTGGIRSTTSLDNGGSRDTPIHSDAAAPNNGEQASSTPSPRTLTWPRIWAMLFLYLIMNVDRISTIMYEYSPERIPLPRVRKHVLPDISTLIPKVYQPSTSSSEIAKVTSATIEFPVPTTAMTHEQKMELAWRQHEMARKETDRIRERNKRAWESGERYQSVSAKTGSVKGNERGLLDSKEHLEAQGGSFLDQVDRFLGWQPLNERE